MAVEEKPSAVAAYASLANSLASGEPYAELSALVALFRAESAVFQSHHWQSRSPNFFGDHGMYSEAYGKVQEQIDGLAERAVGLGGYALVQAVYLTEMTSVLTSALYDGSRASLSVEQMAETSLRATATVIEAIAMTLSSLSSRGRLTVGLENLLQTYADEQEQLAYFFRQRTTP